MTDRNQAHADPERLRAFAHELANYSERIHQLDGEMQAALTRLGETFRDHEYERFREHFRSSRQKLLAFVEDVKAVIPKLRADADDLAASSRVREF
jgi:uncharacterized protein YukE